MNYFIPRLFSFVALFYHHHHHRHCFTNNACSRFIYKYVCFIYVACKIIKNWVSSDGGGTCCCGKVQRTRDYTVQKLVEGRNSQVLYILVHGKVAQLPSFLLLLNKWIYIFTFSLSTLLLVHWRGIPLYEIKTQNNTLYTHAFCFFKRTQNM